MYAYENKLRKAGYKHVAGCDEVGRGPLAGPLVCAAVVLNAKQPIEGLYDSKALTAKKRASLYEQIIANAAAYHVIFIDAETVDKLNVYQASKKGMLMAVEALKSDVDYILSDAMPFTGLAIPHTSLIKGDQKSASIAAASILAKVERDRYMTNLAKDYPEYFFDQHKGYPTKVHLEALKAFGLTKEHRKSFKPVKAILDKQMMLDV